MAVFEQHSLLIIMYYTFPYQKNEKAFG